jgi:uncharacterized delta-60 repeat protein
VQPDGRLVVAIAHGRSAQVRRLLPDGTEDPGFGRDGLVDVEPIHGPWLSGVEVLDDDRILATGAGPGEIGVTPSAVVTALTPQGSVDPTFGVDGSVSIRPFDGNAAFNGVLELPGGDLLAFGYGDRLAGPDDGRYAVVARITSDGDPVPSWGDHGIATFTDEVDGDYGSYLSASATAVVPQPDGGVLVFDGRSVWRLDPDGVLDATFGSHGPGRIMIGHPAALPDGGFVVTGRTWIEGVGYEVSVRRYLPDATIDPSFGDGGEVAFGAVHADDNGEAIALDADGDVLIGGRTTGHGTSGDLLVARVLPDGVLDASVGIDGLLATDVFGYFDDSTEIRPMPDGRVAVLGYAFQPDTYRRFTAVAVYGPHDLDTQQPAATITRPAPDTPYGQLGVRAIRGTSRDGLSGVTGTEAALRIHRADGTCAWMGDRGWVDRSCRRPLWHDTGAGFQWEWDLPRLLPRSIDSRGRWYTAFARATDAGGNVEHRFVDGRNRVNFEIGLE